MHFINSIYIKYVNICKDNFILFIMNSTTFSFLVTTIAVLSTLIGLIPIYINFKNINKIICISLAFASGVMASVSSFSLIPESYHLLNNFFIIIFFIVLGIYISKKIDKLFKSIDNKLYKLGIFNAIALMLHNIPEGILTFSAASTNIKLGISLGLSIILHNIPEGISISIPIYYSTKNKTKAWIYTLLAGFSEVLGAIFTYVFLYSFINNLFIGIILSLTTGIMIYISLKELLPNSLNYGYKKTSYISFLLGFIFMMFFK